MVELTDKRIDQMLHEETMKKEEADTILRSVYTRLMRLYERYFEDIDALNDEVIAELRKYNEETISLVKYYYMDIPEDVCTGLSKFESEYGENLLGDDWHKYLFSNYETFKRESADRSKSEEENKAAFSKQALHYFYEAMDYVFRDGFGTGSETVKSTLSGIAGMIFGKKS